MKVSKSVNFLIDLIKNRDLNVFYVDVIDNII